MNHPQRRHAPQRPPAPAAAPLADPGADSLSIEPPPEGAKVGPSSQPEEPAKPGPVSETPAPEPVPGITWPRDCTVEIPLCLLGERKFLACASEEDALSRYLGLCSGLKSKHKPIIRPLATCTTE